MCELSFTIPLDFGGTGIFAEAGGIPKAQRGGDTRELLGIVEPTLWIWRWCLVGRGIASDTC